MNFEKYNEIMQFNWINLISLRNQEIFNNESQNYPSARTKFKISYQRRALDLLLKLKLPKNIINHVKAVSKKAMKIASEIKTKEIDLKLVKIGAILHDIGRTQSHDLDHAILGGKIIREQGFSESLALIAERHVLGGIAKNEAIELDLPPKDYIPITDEEKIVCLADKYHIGTNKVNIEQRFQNWFDRFGNTDLLINSKKRVEEIERYIYKLMYP